MIGTLKPGMDADISILEVISGKWKFEDYEKETLEINKLIVPRVTIKSGQLIKC
jgi:predicted amidohydrolase